MFANFKNKRAFGLACNAGHITKDLLFKSFSYLGDAKDILHAGATCKEWLSRIDNHVSWTGCTTINEEFINLLIPSILNI